MRKDRYFPFPPQSCRGVDTSAPRRRGTQTHIMKFIEYIPTAGQFEYRRMIERRARQRVLAQLAKGILFLMLAVAIGLLLCYQDPWLR